MRAQCMRWASQLHRNPKVRLRTTYADRKALAETKYTISFLLEDYSKKMAAEEASAELTIILPALAQLYLRSWS